MQQQQQPSEGAANIEPPPRYVQQPLPEGSQWGRILAYPQGDPMGFAFIAFWVIVFGAYVTIVWGGKRRMLLTFALAVASLALFAVFARSLRTWGEILAFPYADTAGFGILVFAAVLMLWMEWLIRRRRRAAGWYDKKWD
jgi:hypothetical protein